MNPARGRIVFPALGLATLALGPALRLSAQTGAQPAPQSTPIAIVSIDSRNPEATARVTGALTVTEGKVVIGASGSITSGNRTTRVTLPRRGLLQVCASSSVKLAADLNVSPGRIPGLMMAMEHGAIEVSLAGGSGANVILTPDFRISADSEGAADMKIRLGPRGDTCVDNAGADAGKAADLVVSSLFEGDEYRVHPGQRVMFEQGSLREVVDNEKEPCGCPPPAPKGNEFPLAQSEGLAPLAAPVAPAAVHSSRGAAPTLGPLVYKSADHAPPPAVAMAPALRPVAPPAAARSRAPKPPARKRTGFFGRIGRFFHRLFGGK
ncbi:MAG: hypothetical protein ACP5FH_10545 [Terracidiphilus sp.]